MCASKTPLSKENNEWTRKLIFSKELIGLLVLVILCGYTRWINFRLPGDDAFMTLKLARNFGERFQFFYNEGEFVYGTSPLYTVIIGVLYRLFENDPILISRYVNTWCDCVSVVLLYCIGKRVGLLPVFSFLATYFFTTSWASINSSTLCMETPLFISLLLLALFYNQMASSKKLDLLVGLLVGLLTLARPEGLFLFISLVITSLFVEKRLNIFTWTSYALVVGSWLFFSYKTFGYLFPPSIASKSLAYFRYPLSALFTLLIYPQKVFLKNNISQDLQWISIASVNIILTISFYFFIKARRKNILIIMVYLIYFVAYSYKNPFIFPWYVVPLEICMVVPVIYVVQTLFVSSNFAFALVSRALAVICAIWLVIYPLLQFSNPITCVSEECGNAFEIPTSTSPELKRDMFVKWDLGTSEREEAYVALAREFSSQITKEKVVLAPEFGAFGYYSEGRIISSIGHISPQVFKFLPVSKEILTLNSAIPVDMVREIAPDYILSLEVFIRKSLLEDEWFKNHYEVLKRLDSVALSSQGLYLFRKKVDQS